MPNVYPVQTNFASGQVSPTLEGRRDLAEYYAGARLLQNVIPLPSGGVTRRPPTKYLGTATSASLLIPFESSPEKSYMIKITPGASLTTFAFYRYSALGTGLIHTFTDSALITGDWDSVSYTQSRDVLFLTFGGTKRQMKLTRISDTSWTLAVTDEEDGPYDPLNGDVDQKLDPSTKKGTCNILAKDEAAAAINNFFNTARDVNRLIRIRHNYPPDAENDDDDLAINWGSAKITAVNVTTGALTTLSFTAASKTITRASGSFITNGFVVGLPITVAGSASNDGSYTVATVAALTMTVVESLVNEAAGASITISYGTNSDRAFTTVNSKYQIGVRPSISLTDPQQTRNWRLGAFYPLTSGEGGYATYAKLFGNRLFYARRNRIMSSCANDFTRFSPTIPDESRNHSVTPDSAIDISLLDYKAEEINWMEGDQYLHIGTNTARYIVTSNASSGLYLISGGSGANLEPNSIKVVKQSTIGSAAIKPVVSDGIIYSRYDKTALLKTEYKSNRDRFEDVNLNDLSDTILLPGVTKLAITNYPFTIIWACLADGTLASLTYDSANKILPNGQTAWAIHTIGCGLVRDIASVKHATGIQELYLIIENENDNGFTLQKMISFDYRDSTVESDYHLVDGYVDQVDGGSGSTGLTGQVHLNGYNMTCIQDGINFPQGVVAGGAVTFEETIIGSYHSGAPMDVRIETMPIDLPSNGTQLHKMKGITDVEVLLHRTLSLTAQMEGSNYSEKISFRSIDDDVESLPPLFSGSKNLQISNVNIRNPRVIFTQEEQAMLTILALNYKVSLEA